MGRLLNLRKAVVDLLNPSGDWIALLPIRLLMAWEFWFAGMKKFHGSNWFARFQDNFRNAMAKAVETAR